MHQTMVPGRLLAKVLATRFTCAPGTPLVVLPFHWNEE